MPRKRTRSSSLHSPMEEQQVNLQQSPAKTLEQPQPEPEPQSQPDQEHQEQAIPSSPPIDQDLDNDQTIHDPPNTSRKATARKKKPVSSRKLAAIGEKLASLKEQLIPVPFTPNKTIDFSKHEILFKRLGLWDFAHLKLDQEIRSDMLALLIAGYDRKERYSVVDGSRIKINRADLARALKLPSKKDKNLANLAPVDSDSEGFGEEDRSVLMDFISNWFLLHEDTWMIPEEIVAAEKLVKEGEPQKVDWANLIWIMAEKELSQGPKLKNCFYASHFQHLMRTLKPTIFEEKETQPAICEEKEEEEEAVEVSVDEEDGAKRTKTLLELQSQTLVELQSEGNNGDEGEERNTELNLGQEKMPSPSNEEEQRVVVDEEEQRVVVDEEEQRVVVGEEEMDVDDGKEECQWFLDGKKNAGDIGNGTMSTDHCFRPCSMNEPGNRECDNESKPMEYEAPTSKFDQLNRLSPVDLVSAIENNCNIPFSSPGHHFDPSPSELFLPRGGVHTNHGSNPGLSTTFRNSFKREFDGHFPDGDPQKKMRVDGNWEFDSCMENIQGLMSKARMLYMEKEQSIGNTLQHYADEIQRRDFLVDALQRNKLDDQRKMSAELQKVSLELYVTTNLLQGYKRAYEETRDAFSEYRKRSQQPDEPLYRDVPGTGGLVLSEADFAKFQLERQEEDRVRRRAIEEQIKCFEHDWEDQFQAFDLRVSSLEERLVGFEQEFPSIKGRLQASRSPKQE